MTGRINQWQRERLGLARHGPTIAAPSSGMLFSCFAQGSRIGPSVASRTTRRAAWLESSSQTCCSNAATISRLATAGEGWGLDSNGRWQRERAASHSQPVLKVGDDQFACFHVPSLRRPLRRSTPVDFKRQHYRFLAKNCGSRMYDAQGGVCLAGGVPPQKEFFRPCLNSRQPCPRR